MSKLVDKESAPEKIKRLLRLAEKAGTIQEAAAAAGQAQRLMAKFNIDAAELGDLWTESHDVNVSHLDGDDALYSGMKLPFWVCRLAAQLCDLNHCHAYVSSARFRGQRRRHRRICVAGDPFNLSAVKYLFEYLRKEITSLCRIYSKAWREQRGTRRTSTAWQNDFKLGAVDEVLRRMREDQEDLLAHVNHKALVRIGSLKKAATQWVEENVANSGRAKKARARGLSDFSGYLLGRRAGEKVTLKATNTLPEPEGDTP